VSEWDNSASWRRSNGWRGSDYVHGDKAGVRILDYFYTADDKLVGAVHFTAGAESHKGFCHGGSMCAVMDDVLGWTAFCVGATEAERGPAIAPWSGFTAQVNVTLSRPVPVGSLLCVEGEVKKVERRKVFVSASLYDGDDREAGPFCTAEGLFIKKRTDAPA